MRSYVKEEFEVIFLKYTVHSIWIMKPHSIFSIWNLDLFNEHSSQDGLEIIWVRIRLLAEKSNPLAAPNHERCKLQVLYISQIRGQIPLVAWALPKESSVNMGTVAWCAPLNKLLAVLITTPSSEARGISLSPEILNSRLLPTMLDMTTVDGSQMLGRPGEKTSFLV